MKPDEQKLRTGAVEFAAAEVVPAAFGAHLDDVAIELGVLRGEFVEFAGLRERPTVRGTQPVAIDIRNKKEILAATDRAVLPHPVTDVPRGTQEFRMGVAHVVTADASRSQVPEDGPTGQ